MEHYVYKIVNSQGEVEHVGQTKNPTKRLYHHTKFKPRPNQSYGKFYGRTDIEMRICGIFETKSESYWGQILLQKHYGLETDSDKLSKPQIGKIPWNKGITHSDETKAKLRQLALLQHSKKNSSLT